MKTKKQGSESELMFSLGAYWEYTERINSISLVSGYTKPCLKDIVKSREYPT